MPSVLLQLSFVRMGAEVNLLVSAGFFTGVMSASPTAGWDGEGVPAVPGRWRQWGAERLPRASGLYWRPVL